MSSSSRSQYGSKNSTNCSNKMSEVLMVIVSEVSIASANCADSSSTIRLVYTWPFHYC